MAVEAECPAELRYDFRAVYGVAYDEVETSEAIDLVRTLPDGCMTVSKLQPARAWTRERHAMCDLMDTLWVLKCWTPGKKLGDAIEEADKIRQRRPAEVEAAKAKAKAERKRADTVRERLSNTEWEEAE